MCARWVTMALAGSLLIGKITDGASAEFPCLTGLPCFGCQIVTKATVVGFPHCPISKTCSHDNNLGPGNYFLSIPFSRHVGNDMSFHDIRWKNRAHARDWNILSAFVFKNWPHKIPQWSFWIISDQRDGGYNWKCYRPHPNSDVNRRIAAHVLIEDSDERAFFVFRSDRQFSPARGYPCAVSGD
jgi:hypothetical protein